MTPDAISDQQFTLLATATPLEKVVRVAVSHHDWSDAKAPALGSKYRDFAFGNRPRVAQYGDYVCTGDGDGPPGYLFVYFAKAKTEEEKNTPVKVEGDTIEETWPDILEGIRFVEDGSAPIALRAPSEDDPSGVGTIFVNRKIAFLVITPETTVECAATLEIFQADTPFTGLSYPKPTPGHVEWNFGAAGGGSFAALHPEIRIARPPLQYKVVADATPGFVDAPYQRDLIFPATKFKTWRPFMRAKTGFENGIYVLRRWTVRPPPKPKPVYRS